MARSQQTLSEWCRTAGLASRPAHWLTGDEAGAMLGLAPETVATYCERLHRIGYVVRRYRRGTVVHRRRFIPQACIEEYLSRARCGTLPPIEQVRGRKVSRPIVVADSDCQTAAENWDGGVVRFARCVYWPAVGSYLALSEALGPVLSPRIPVICEIRPSDQLRRNPGEYLRGQLPVYVAILEETLLRVKPADQIRVIRELARLCRQINLPALRVR